MTLKEAKRAYKKEGATVRFTASQLARADRIDAKEKQRKKELDKERNRAENKRKREEKDAKDRSVRQKMLEEGRISVEDTWGKVTASQPRLNTFFGRKPAVAPSKSNLRAELATDKEVPDPSEHPDAGNQEAEAVASANQDSPCLDRSAAVTEIPLYKSPSRQKTPNDVKYVAPSSRLGKEFFPPTGSRSSILRELRPSQINTQSSAPARSLRDDKRKLSSREAVSPQIASNVETMQGRSSPPPTRQAPGSVLRSSGSNTISDGSPTELLPEINVIENGQDLGDDESLRLLFPSEKKEEPALPGGGRAWASSLDLTDEEDFTDGIDDETFLQLCASQKPSIESAATRENPIPHGLAESFNSVFNEFEDEDLIALAEEVEAGLDAPAQTPLIAPVVDAGRDTPKAPAQQPSQPPRDFPKPHLPRDRQAGTGLTEPKVKNTIPSGSRRQGASSKTLTSPKSQRVPNTSLVSTSADPPMTDSKTLFARRSQQTTCDSTRTADTNSRALGNNLRAKAMNPKVVHPAVKLETSKVTQLTKETVPLTSSPQLLKKRTWPKGLDEFPGLGPSTQALSLKLLAQAEAQRDEQSKFELG